MDRFLTIRMKDKKMSREVAQEYDVRQRNSSSGWFRQKLHEQLVTHANKRC
jgi:hypothetical protein